MKLIIVVLVLFAVSCSPTPDHLKETNLLLTASAGAVNHASEIFYNQIKRNSYEYETLGRFSLLKTEKIDSVITRFSPYLDEQNASFSRLSKEEYLMKYSETIENINQILDLASYDLSEEYQFQIEDSTITMDNVERKVIPSVIRLNLAIIKSNVFHFLSLASPLSIECWFGKSIYIVNEITSPRKIQFDLSSREFSIYEDRYIKVDSLFMNGSIVHSKVDIMDQFTFGQISIDSLKPGSYKIFGTAICYPNGQEYTESFSQEFSIRAHKSKIE
jgi:hypothetical protein